MPDRVDVALAILTLVLAVVAVLGRLLLGLLDLGEHLSRALRWRGRVANDSWRDHGYMPDPPDPFGRVEIGRDYVERRHHQTEARVYALARLRDLVGSAGQE
jgi:hypothetical protein